MFFVVFTGLLGVLIFFFSEMLHLPKSSFPSVALFRSELELS